MKWVYAAPVKAFSATRAQRVLVVALMVEIQGVWDSSAMLNVEDAMRDLRAVDSH